MRTIMARSPHESSFSKRYFQLRKKNEDEEDDDEKALRSFSFSSSQLYEEDNNDQKFPMQVVPSSKKNLPARAVKKFRSVFGKHQPSLISGLGSKLVCTLFGYRHGHVNFAFQEDPRSDTGFFIELPTRTSSLIREMASGMVRIALECDKVEQKGVKLLEESLWRTYCNGRKCGIAIRQEVGPKELKVLKAVGPISMGAGVLMGNEGELMYMRAKFERVIWSRHSEAFYMLNPGCTRGPELSLYLFRV